MNFFDKTLKNIFNTFNNFINFLKKITRIEIIRKLEKFSENIYSSALIISCLVIFIIGLIVYAKANIGWILPLAIFGPVVILFIAFLAKDFHGACSDLIKSNTTSISNDAILRFGAITSLIFAAIAFIAAIVAVFSGSLAITVWALLSSLLLFVSAGTQFNPSLLNVEVNKKSSSGEDFIAIFSLSLKSMVFFEKIISTILIVLGNIYLIANVFTSKLVFFFSGLGFLFAGISFPILIYISFTVLWFFNSIFLAILALGRKK
tara:strand:+ start:392 stop:1177 length:786 start_codon:yes stop_codon:yes gene_type:complete